LADQAGAFLQLQGQPVTPLAATLNCPNLTTPQTFQFITIPAPNQAAPPAWNPTTDTAFGSVTIGTNGSTVNFSNIQQFTLPTSGSAPGMPATPFVSAATGLCSFGPYGNTISAPPTVTVTNPGGAPGNQSASPSATVGIGPTGFLVESNAPNTGVTVSNLLGAGSGAVGVPQPSSPLGATPVSGQTAPQYLGFIYNAAGTSEVMSLGFATQPSSCSSVTPSTPTLIYGGDFQNGDPTTSTDGYSQCNFALDLGTESSTSNGLYPSAKVWTGTGFNGSISTASTPGVAVVGQLQGKFVILVITQNFAIYLTQSN
jgi:hypothetical protein